MSATLATTPATLDPVAMRAAARSLRRALADEFLRDATAEHVRAALEIIEDALSQETK